MQEGAVDVFLDFISYSGGPLAEDLLEVIQRPVSILWGKLHLNGIMSLKTQWSVEHESICCTTCKQMLYNHIFHNCLTVC